MKRLILLLCIPFFANAAHAQKITLVKGKKPKSSIVLPAHPTEIESKAAVVLQNYIEQISGAKLKIHSDQDSSKGAEILIGHVNRPDAMNAPDQDLGKDGFLLFNTSDKLIIKGGTGKGLLYGVNQVLEKFLGVRKYSSKVSYVPKNSSIVLKDINDKETPSFTFRRIEYRDANVGEFADWNRLSEVRQWGSWCHTFSDLLKPEEYGTSHPEYFSFYEGARHPELNKSGEPVSQLCLSNPEVLEIVVKHLQEEIDKNPTAKYWSVSQNDNVHYCQCPFCKKIDSEYAAQNTDQPYVTGTMKYASTGMGSIMFFLNKLSKRFPDNVISTLAYQYTRKPPVNITPAANINIMLCDIESPRDVPINKGDIPFSKDIAGWGKLSKDILVWDYVIQFRNLLAPFPNLRTLQPNIQFLHNNGVTALFEQGNRQSGGEFAELRAYILTKLMWNKDVNVDDVINDFLNGYYGKAAKHIRKYIDLTHDKLESSGTRLTIFGNPDQAKKTFLSDSLMKIYNRLFNRAEYAVRKKPELLNRVKTARLPVYYAMLEIARSEKTGPRGAFIIDSKGVQKPNPAIEDILDKFVSQCESTGVTRIAEWNTIPHDYLVAYQDFLAGKPAQPVKRLF